MRSRTWKLVRLVAPIGLIPLFACLAPPVESPKTTVTQETSVRVAQSVKNKVDLLFMVDNSLSMAPKQQELQARFPQLIKQLDTFAMQGNPASYHIGVVSSDLGAGQNTQNCKPGGDGGRLQVTPNPMGTYPPPANCSGFSLSGNVHYLDYNQITGTNNIVGGLTVDQAFTCMAHVGDNGCGFEHQLESAYRALHNNIPENQGFLRPDAILAVVFVTDEDDCSAPDDTDLFVNSAQAISMYGVLHSFRCTQFGVQCNGQPVPPMSVSGLTGCSSYDLSNGGKLTDITTYMNFFTKPAALGGVKADPNDVILVGISAPADPVGVQITMPCADQSGTMSCPILNHSCVAASAPTTFFGDPAVRLNKVVSAAKNHNLTSICDTDYTAAIQSLGDLIISSIGAGCLNSPIKDRPDGTPDCVVTDVTTLPDGSQSSKEIPSCAENNHTIPCWQVINKLTDYNNGMCYVSPLPGSCKLPSTCQPVPNAMHIGDTPPPTCAGNGPADPNVCELVTVSIDRGTDSTGKPNDAPPGTIAQVSCATIASSM